MRRLLCSITNSASVRGGIEYIYTHGSFPINSFGPFSKGKNKAAVLRWLLSCWSRLMQSWSQGGGNTNMTWRGSTGTKPQGHREARGKEIQSNHQVTKGDKGAQVLIRSSRMREQKQQDVPGLRSPHQGSLEGLRREERQCRGWPHTTSVSSEPPIDQTRFHSRICK